MFNFDLSIFELRYNEVHCHSLKSYPFLSSKIIMVSQNLDYCSRKVTHFLKYPTVTILGDPGTVIQVGRKGGTKVLKYGQKSPWVPTLTELFPKIQADAGSWLGTKNALYYWAQSANGFSWVLFLRSYTTAIVSITDCLAHSPKNCTQSGNFQFDTNSPSDFKILSAQKKKTLFQKYKLELTTGIHACVGRVLRKY